MCSVDLRTQVIHIFYTLIAYFQIGKPGYNLEHILDLQSVLKEVHRVLWPEGRFLVALPCEGGLLLNLGLEISTRRAFQKKYGINYDKLIAYEHVWNLAGVLQEIKRSGRFSIDCYQLFPTRLPTVHLNLVACLSCSKLAIAA